MNNENNDCLIAFVTADYSETDSDSVFGRLASGFIIGTIVTEIQTDTVTVF